MAAERPLRFGFSQVFGERTDYDEVQDGAWLASRVRAVP